MKINSDFDIKKFPLFTRPYKHELELLFFEGNRRSWSRSNIHNNISIFSGLESHKIADWLIRETEIKLTNGKL